MNLLLAVLHSCPEVAAPNGSYVSNGTLTSRTFLCKSGSVFPDSGERERTLECRNGKWNETIARLPTCVGKDISQVAKFIRLSLSKDKTTCARYIACYIYWQIKSVYTLPFFIYTSINAYAYAMKKTCSCVIYIIALPLYEF